MARYAKHYRLIIAGFTIALFSGVWMNRHAILVHTGIWRDLDSQFITFRGSRGFAMKSKKLKYSEIESREILKERIASAQHANEAAIFTGTCVAIVDGHYVFSPPSKNTVPIYGYYVNGMTGQYFYVPANEELDIPISQARYLGYNK